MWFPPGNPSIISFAVAHRGHFPPSPGPFGSSAAAGSAGRRHSLPSRRQFRPRPSRPVRRPGMSEHLVTIERMRPALKPGLLTVWRNRDTVQIGIDPRRAIALTGMRGAAVLLGLLDGSRDLAQILAAAGDAGISAEAADRVITLLAVGGALHDFPITAYRAMPHGLRTRLAPELATAALAHGDADGGALILARRQGACVRVEGMSRVGLCIASFLTASGIGMVISAGRTPGTGAGRGAPPPACPPVSAHIPPPA